MSTRDCVVERFWRTSSHSLLDLVEDGSAWEQVKSLALALKDAGVTILNANIGWHEARIRE